MLKEIIYRGDISAFKLKALCRASGFDVACYLDSNQYTDKYSAFDVLIAAGSKSEISVSSGKAFGQLKEFMEENKGWLPGFFTYDLKNEVEQLHSENPDQLNFPDLFFFVPNELLIIRENSIQIQADDPEKTLQEIESQEIDATSAVSEIKIKARISFEDYIASVKNIQKHIHRGDIYEMNFCQEFYAENAILNPVNAFIRLNALSPAPFAAFFKLKNKYILSASPERFLAKRQSKLISQPIKGTAKRSKNSLEDQKNKSRLQKDIKERSENVMIVDLVRNDLTRSAQPASVTVEELFGIYSFEQVHQMISTVVCQANPSLSASEIIKNTFPMGSMTGAPKIRAMELIEEFERSKRGVFSGAVGYFTPDGDFDFNVIIRTLLYNAENNYLSFQAGSAITSDSIPEKEYDECLLKAEAIRKLLSGKK